MVSAQRRRALNATARAAATTRAPHRSLEETRQFSTHSFQRTLATTHKHGGDAPTLVTIAPPMHSESISPNARAAAAARLSTASRVRVALLALGAAVLLAVAAWLSPSAVGIGTHTQLGIPACTWPTTLGLPCPSCGMTTAFAFAADGRLVDSFRTQPMGCLLAVATGALAVVAGYAAVTGSQLVGVLAKSMSASGWWLLGSALFLSWGYKILDFRGAL